MAHDLGGMSLGRQSWELVGGPVAAGILCGVLLGTHAWLYLLGVVLITALGLPAGGQHRALPGAAARGAFAGAVFGLAVLAVHRLTGWEAALALPEPRLLFLGWTIVPGCAATVLAFLFMRRAVRSCA